MNTFTKILKVLFTIVYEILRVFLKVVKVMCVLFFGIIFGTTEANKRQYDAEYYGYE